MKPNQKPGGKNKTKERWGKLAEKHVEREAWLETHKETKGL